MKPKAVAGPAMRLGATLAALAIVVQAITACSTNDQGRFRGRTTDQVKQACDPQRQTPEECSRTLDR
jgi:hypothetical protein